MTKGKKTKVIATRAVDSTKTLASVASIGIYPPIGITRVGDSEDEFFFAPEVPGKFPVPEGGFKDKSGKIKRQAARFRVFAFDAQGEVLYEITRTTVESIVWKIQVANKKASWYQFQGKNSTQQGLRNPTIQVKKPEDGTFYKPDERTDLIIQSELLLLSYNERKELKGQFKGKSGQKETEEEEEEEEEEGEEGEKEKKKKKKEPEDVYLGEAWVDDDGCLNVLGGRGKSAQRGDKNGHALILTDFDNEDWYDDTSDGPIGVTVKLMSGQKFTAKNKAWVMCSPPKYTTDIAAPTTLYDVMENIYEGPRRADSDSPYDVGQVIYYEHIYPVLERVCKISWVNSIADQVHGPSGPGNFLDEKWQERLTSKEERFKDYKKNVLARLRFPDTKKYKIQRSGQSYTYFMPALSGDGGRTTDGDQTTWTSLTELQYDRFVKWANNDFELGEKNKYTNYDEIPLESCPAALTQAALEWTIGLPLFPGIEMSYPAEDPNTYDLKAPSFYFNQDFKPGDMCRNHWWPSARPDNILTEADYEQVNKSNPGAPIATRLSNRKLWERGLQPNHTDFYPGQPYFANTDMVHHWSKLGFISPTERVISGSETETVYVERERGQIVRSAGIDTIKDLKTHLQSAMVVELMTIPLYLYALYSIKVPDEPAPAHEAVLRAIVAEEMLHLSLAGNMLLAIGGEPILYDPNLIPSYPCNLPFRTPVLNLDLASATKEQIGQFIEIELPGDPQAPPESGEYHTIGQFYKAIEQGFLNLQNEPDLFLENKPECQFAPGSGYTPRIPDAGGLVVVKDLATAQQAIANIVKEGEGFEGPYSDEDRQELSHYQRFLDLQKVTDSYQLYSIVTSPKTEKYQYSYVKKLSQVFDAAYCYLLIAIEHLWKLSDPTDRQKVTYGAMYSVMMGVLAPLAKLLVSLPVTPGSTQTAAPAFQYYRFKKCDDYKCEKDKSKHKCRNPKQQLNDLILETIADFNSTGTSDEPGVGAQVGILITVQATIQQLYGVPLPKHNIEEDRVDEDILKKRAGMPKHITKKEFQNPYTAKELAVWAQDIAPVRELDTAQGAALLLRTNGASHLRREPLPIARYLGYANNITHLAQNRSNLPPTAPHLFHRKK